MGDWLAHSHTKDFLILHQVPAALHWSLSSQSKRNALTREPDFMLCSSAFIRKGIHPRICWGEPGEGQYIALTLQGEEQGGNNRAAVQEIFFLLSVLLYLINIQIWPCRVDRHICFQSKSAPKLKNVLPHYQIELTVSGVKGRTHQSSERCGHGMKWDRNRHWISGQMGNLPASISHKNVHVSALSCMHRSTREGDRMTKQQHSVESEITTKSSPTGTHSHVKQNIKEFSFLGS